MQQNRDIRRVGITVEEYIGNSSQSTRSNNVQTEDAGQYSNHTPDTLQGGLSQAWEMVLYFVGHALEDILDKLVYYEVRSRKEALDIISNNSEIPESVRKTGL